MALGELLLLGPHLPAQLGDLGHLALAQGGHLAQRGDAPRRVGEVARGEKIGHEVVVAVVAVGFARHRGILGPRAVKAAREPPGHAVRARHLVAQVLGLALGGLQQLAAVGDLSREAACALLAGRAALLELRDLALLVGDLLFEGLDRAPLLLDPAVLRRGGGSEQQQREGCRHCFHHLLSRSFAPLRLRGCVRSGGLWPRRRSRSRPPCATRSGPSSARPASRGCRPCGRAARGSAARR